MAVNSDPLQMSPYTSTVPLVQVPPSAIDQETRPEQPLQGAFKGKSTGALAIGDALLKGIMAGHQVKEQRKNAQAQATIAAADGATQAAWQQYQDALTKAGGKQDDPGAQAAYQAYQNVFNQSKQAKAQFVIPEKPAKGQSGQKKGVKGEVKTGWNNFKDFFEANPHIVPSIALATMQPKPPGLSPEGQQQVQSLQATELANQEKQQQVAAAKQKQDDLNFVALHSSLTPDQVLALPPEDQKQLAAAKFRLEQEQPSKAKYTTWQSPDGGQFLVLPEGEQPPQGYSPWQKTPASQGLGSESWVLTRAAQIWGIPVGQLTPADKNYLDSMAAYAKKRAQLTATASGTSTNIQGDRESWIRQQIGPPPTPPNGRSAIDAATFAQGGQGIGPPPRAGAAATGQEVPPPPVAPKTPKASSGGIQPQPGGKQTWQTMQVTRQAVKAQQEGYQKAESSYTKAITAADKAWETAVRQAKTDPDLIKQANDVRDAAHKAATAQLSADKVAVTKQYDETVKSIGGTPGDQNKVTADTPPQGATGRVKDKNGNVIGWAVNGQFVAVGQTLGQ